MMKKHSLIAAVILGITVLMTQTLYGYETIEVEDSPFKLAPLKDGSVKILSIALYPAHYHSIELAKRLDCEITTIRLDSSFSAGYGTDDFQRSVVYWRKLQITKEEMTEDALEALEKDYDIIIIGARPVWSKYPATVKQAILNKVKSGAALISFSPEKLLADELKKMPKATLQLNSFAAIKEKTAFKADYYRLGKGIIAVMEAPIDNRNGHLISDSDKMLYEEYKYRRIANLIYKLSKGIQHSNLIQAEPAGNNGYELTVKDVSTAMSLKYRLLDEDYNLIGEKNLAAKVSNGKISVKLPQLQNGEYAVEFELISDGRIADWISGVLKVDSNPKISSATLKKNTLAAGDMIDMALSYSDDAKGASLLMKIKDMHDRCYFEKTYKALPSTIEIPVPDGTLSVVNNIELCLLKGARKLDKKVVEFTLPRKAVETDFDVLLWMIGGNSVRQKHFLRAVYELGISGSANCYDAGSLARQNLRGIPYTTVMGGKLIDAHLFNDKWIGEQKARCRKFAADFAKYGGLGYTLGDENYVSAFKKEGRFSNSPKATEAFRAHLSNEYTDIEALNAQWETSYGGFNEIQFTTEKELFISETNPSPWFDYREFISNRFISVPRRGSDDSP